jgi:CubicO group peptidase (beta-lactamase class C family)
VHRLDQRFHSRDKSNRDRFGNFVNNETKLRSMSVGKTMVSYVMGHAICKGYIDSIDSTLNDWDLANNTLYKNQKIIDLLNMTAGDQKYVYGSDFKDGDDTDTITAKEAMKKMSNKKRSKSKYNYNGLLPHLLMNYILFKSGDDFENLLEDIFQNEAKIKHSVYFFKHPKTHKDEGNANSMFFDEQRKRK